MACWTTDASSGWANFARCSPTTSLVPWPSAACHAGLTSISAPTGVITAIRSFGQLPQVIALGGFVRDSQGQRLIQILQGGFGLLALGDVVDDTDQASARTAVLERAARQRHPALLRVAARG